MFVILEKIAQVEPKYVDIVLLENYAAFQHRFSSFFSWCSSVCICMTVLLFYGIYSSKMMLMSFIHNLFYGNYGK
jgi:hypothetical protein